MVKTRRGKRGRSPSADASRHSRTLRHAEAPHPAPCGCPAAAKVHLLEARVAELEAELKRTTALLTDAFHDDPDVQTLRHRMEPPDGPGTYTAAALRSVWQARLSDGFLRVVRAALAMPMVECDTVDPAVTVSSCVPHAVVPSVVAARVVAPFKAADIAFVGHVDGIVPVDAPAAAQIEALHGLLAGRHQKRRFKYSPLLREVLCKLCATRLPKAALERLVSALARANLEETSGPAFLSVWCQFRLGVVSLDTFLAAERPWPQPEIRTVFRSAVAVDEFFLPAARVCTPAQAAKLCEFLQVTDMNLLATVEFRDQFFTRLATTPGISEANLLSIASVLEEKAKLNPTVFLEAQFVLDFCTRSLPVVDWSRNPRDGLLPIFASLLSSSHTQLAVDEFFVRVAHGCTLAQAERFCEFLKAANKNLLATVEFRDQFFTRLASTPGISEDSMGQLARVLKKHADLYPDVCLEPQFVLDFCAKGMSLIQDNRSEWTELVRHLAPLLSQAAAVAKGEQLTSFVQAARDSFFIPAVKATPRFQAWHLFGPLEEITRDDACAALFCTADFRDRIFVAFVSASTAHYGGRMSARSSAPLARALANIAAAAPLAQRQALFATEEFRDTVMTQLVLSALYMYPDDVAAVRAALVCIAVNDDGSLHEVFAHDDGFCRLASSSGTLP